MLADGSRVDKLVATNPRLEEIDLAATRCHRVDWKPALLYISSELPPPHIESTIGSQATPMPAITAAVVTSLVG